MSNTWKISFKEVEIKTSMLFNLVFANNTILPGSFLLISHWIILFNFCSYWINLTVAELVIPVRTPSKEEKVEIEIWPVTAETYTRKSST